MSRPGLDRAGRPYVATWKQCRDRGPILLCRDKKFLVVRGTVVWCCDTAFWCHDKAGLAGRCRNLDRSQRSRQSASERDNAHDSVHCAHYCACSVCVLCTRPACDSALCCALFMDTIHEHCSWTLFKKKKRKKKSTKMTPGNWGVTCLALHHLSIGTK